jgi:hypothetical protein
MARAAIYALYQLGCRNVFVYNRTAARARDVAAHFNAWAASQAASVAQQQQQQQQPVNGNRSPTAAVNGVNGAGTPPPTREMCRVLTSLSDSWPAGFQLPTMVISCVPATSADGSPPADFVMPLDWLRSPTGGVVVEVS